MHNTTTLTKMGPKFVLITSVAIHTFRKTVNTAARMKTHQHLISLLYFM